MPGLTSSHRYRRIAALLLVFVVVFVLHAFVRPHRGESQFLHRTRLLAQDVLQPATHTAQQPGIVKLPPGQPVKQNHQFVKVAVVEPSAYHQEVFGAVIYTLNQLGVNTTLFLNPVRAKTFHDTLGPLLGHIYPGMPGDASALAGPITRQEFDLIIFNTCDSFFLGPLPNSKAMWSAINSSATHVMCFTHQNEGWGSVDDQALLRDVARTGRLNMMQLGPHATEKIATTLRDIASNQREPFWEVVPTGYIAPVFELPDSVLPKNHSPRKVQHAGILGRVWKHQRDYEGIFRDLEEAILDDPEFWGYQVSESETQRLFPLDGQGPFQLHLIGYQDAYMPTFLPLLSDPDFPVVVNYTQVSDIEFHNAIRKMDVILPLFNGNKYTKGGRASASIPASILDETPILATQDIIESYRYLDQLAYILQPISWGPVDALKALRAGNDPWTEEFGSRAPRPYYSEIGPRSSSDNGPESWTAWFSPHRARAVTQSGDTRQEHNAEAWIAYKRRLVEMNKRVFANVIKAALDAERWRPPAGQWSSFDEVWRREAEEKARIEEGERKLKEAKAKT